MSGEQKSGEQHSGTQNSGAQGVGGQKSGEQKSDQQQANQQRAVETIPFQFPTSEHHPAAPAHVQFPQPQPADGTSVTPASTATMASDEPVPAPSREPIHFPTSTPAAREQSAAPSCDALSGLKDAEKQTEPEQLAKLEQLEDPEKLSAEDLRLMADTMPGEGPGDD
ncbi:MAG: hypothetical protein ABIT83_10120 [Massilia sp.]